MSPSCVKKVSERASFAVLASKCTTFNEPTRLIQRRGRSGGFCGYRNIQSLISFIISTRSSGCEIFGNDLPSIFQIQDLIEKAWEMGFNPSGRQETGGIKGTRKYIGTAEVPVAMVSWEMSTFSSLTQHLHRRRPSSTVFRFRIHAPSSSLPCQWLFFLTEL